MTVTRRGLLGLEPRRAAPVAGRWLRVARTIMACRFEVTLPPVDSRHVPAAAAALDEADRIEALLSVFRADTEVSALNRDGAAGAASVSPELYTLVSRCAVLHADTEGAFDITSTPLSRCWGFLRRAGRVPDPGAIDVTREIVGMARVRLDGGRRSIAFDRPGVELGFGAIGKGYALDRMRAVLARRDVSRALASAGGSSVLALGRRDDPWPVDIGSPLRPGRRLARLWIGAGALGTSGAGEQAVVADGVRYGHVIDPRTGWPARGVLSSSVVAASAAEADALSTAFLIGGPELAQRYCASHPGVLALLVLDDRAARPCVYGAFSGARIEV